MPTETVVRVVNLATRRVITLPESSNSVAPSVRFHEFLSHQIFSIGHDSRNDTYKVARFFFGSMDPIPTGGYRHNFGMEVFTIGIDQHWRETTAQPPYPVDISGKSTFFKGSLFWIIDEMKLPIGESPQGFLRFKLEDESFCVTPPPPHCQGLIYETSYLAELRGELSVAHAGPKYESIEIWMCNDLDTNTPRWNRLYTVKTFCLLENPLFQATMYYQCQYLLDGQVLKDIVGVNGSLMHHRLGSIMPYIPSLVPL
jgi:F-box interacting protein